MEDQHVRTLFDSLGFSWEKQRALSAIFLVFCGDPFFRWFIPEPVTYVQGGIALMDAFGGKAFENGTAFAPSNYEGASFWLPPKIRADQVIMDRLKPKPSDLEIASLI